MRKKWITLVALGLLLIGGILLYNAHREGNVVVWGELSPKDQAEIKRVLHAEMRRNIFPDFSWASVGALPTKGLAFLQMKIQRLEYENDTKNFIGQRVFVRVGKTKGASDLTFELRQDPAGWTIYRNNFPG